MKQLILTFAILVISNLGFGQEEMRPRKNQISGELLTFYGVGISYERITNANGFFNGSLRGRVITSFSSKPLSPSFGGSLLIGWKHSFELGVDYLINYSDFTDTRFNRVDPILGYRFRHKNGFTMRVFFPITFYTYFGIPDMGLSVGCAF